MKGNEITPTPIDIEAQVFMNLGLEEGIKDGFEFLGKGSEKKLIRDLGPGWGGGRGFVMNGGEKSEGLKHNRTESRDVCLFFDTEKEKFSEVMGEIVTDLSEDILTHTNRGCVKNT